MKNTGVVLGLAAVVGSALVAGDASADASAFFQRIKDKENVSALLGPVPPATSHIMLGTIDCDHGDFTLASFPMSETDMGYGPGANGLDIIAHVTSYEIGAFAKSVHMQVTAQNRRGRPLSLGVHFSQGGNGTGPTTTSDVVDADVGESTGTFTFWVKCGDKTSSGPQLFNDGKPYPPHPSASQAQTESVNVYDHQHYWADGGAFLVEAFPVAVLYEPPMDHQKKNQAEYIARQSIGSDATFAYSNASTNTRGVTPPMNGVNEVSSLAKAAGGALEKTGNPYAMAAGAVLQVIGSGLGSTSATTENGSSTLTSNGLSTRMSSAQTIKTGTGPSLLGPGDGDYIWYHRNAYFAWEAENNNVHSVFLGSEFLEGQQVATLKADLKALQAAGRPDARGAQTHLTADTITSLLKLDPFAARGSPSLPASRFVDVTSSLTGSDRLDHVNWSGKLAIKREYTTGGASSSFTTNTTQYSKGWLSFLGLGITQDQTLTTNVGLSRTADSYTITTEAVSVTLNADAHDTWCTKVYFDKLFSTFAFKPCQ